MMPRRLCRHAARPIEKSGEDSMPARAKLNLEKRNLEVMGTQSLAADLSRRGFVATASAAAVGGFGLTPKASHAAIVRTDVASLPPYGNGTLPPGIRSRSIANVNGMSVHIL